MSLPKLSIVLSSWTRLSSADNTLCGSDSSLLIKRADSSVLMDRADSSEPTNWGAGVTKILDLDGDEI